MVKSVHFSQKYIVDICGHVIVILAVSPTMAYSICIVRDSWPYLKSSLFVSVTSPVMASSPTLMSTWDFVGCIVISSALRCQIHVLYVQNIQPLMILTQQK